MYKHNSQAGWVAVRKQFRLIHSILLDGRGLVKQDAIALLIVSDWRDLSTSFLVSASCQH